MATEKPVVVRMKRKASLARIDAIWLEVNERPFKRSLVDLERLSISGHKSQDSGEVMPKRLLLQHIETVSSSDQVKDVLHSILPNSSKLKDLVGKIKERSGYFKQELIRDQLRSAARQEHKEHVRGVRFQQIWKSRRGDVDSMRELCQLYEVVRIDEEDGKPRRKKELDPISAEDSAILCNYLPLLREYISSAAEEIESEMMAYVSKEATDNYVYDLYTVGEEVPGRDEDISHDYPLLQVNEEDDLDDTNESEYDSEDSNAENNSKNDYPDEESSHDGEEDVDPFGDFECASSDYEHEFVVDKSHGDAHFHGYDDGDDHDLDRASSDHYDEGVEASESDEDDWRWSSR
ncbi:hypothetical protein HPP92_015428 [Vanilla planifolia]|uniref:Probable RNA polymerase II nuclear localization protein SLC7A6OS n=1 Tax=Vanilla planifolia TaxID=51239 RepID=A0A835QHU8_VANPL|nr:hypothetical protein HPP92_015428 [Vanilla planifolia]